MSLLPMRNRIRFWGKEILFPGLDLHTRCRYRFLSRYFRKGAIDTLGCGVRQWGAILRGLPARESSPGRDHGAGAGTKR